MSIPVYYLGVDPGPANCGFAVVEDQGKRVVLRVRGVLHPPKGAGKFWYERFEPLVEAFEGLIKKYMPVAAAVEQIVWYGRRKGVLGLAQFTGAVFGFLRSRISTVWAVLPAWVKSHAKRGAPTPHEADAEALARFAAAGGGNGAGLRTSNKRRRKA